MASDPMASDAGSQRRGAGQRTLWRMAHSWPVPCSQPGASIARVNGDGHDLAARMEHVTMTRMNSSFLAGFARSWWSIDLPDVRPHPAKNTTYSAFDWRLLPPSHDG